MLSDILDYMRKNREASVSEIALYLKMDRSLVESVLNELADKGRINRRTIQHVSCGCCSGNCASAACGETVVYSYIDRSVMDKKELAS